LNRADESSKKGINRYTAERANRKLIGQMNAERANLRGKPLKGHTHRESHVKAKGNHLG
jgi:hypothetical protein